MYYAKDSATMVNARRLLAHGSSAFLTDGERREILFIRATAFMRLCCGRVRRDNSIRIV